MRTEQRQKKAQDRPAATARITGEGVIQNPKQAKEDLGTHIVLYFELIKWGLCERADTTK